MNEEMEDAIQARCKTVIQESQADLLKGIGDLISQISEKQKISNESQLAKISSIISSSDIPKFKRKSNEEQFKHNAKVICKLDEATENIEALNVEKGKEKITEGKVFLFYICKVVIGDNCIAIINKI